jgi:hypothetical protein
MHQVEEHRTPVGTVQQFLYGWWQAERPESGCRGRDAL